MDPISPEHKTPLVQALLALADDKFILGHRNADWTGLAPMLEEDIAFSSLAQDDIAHASAIYAYVAGLLGGRADALAYGRAAGEYRCARIVELHDGFDWSLAIVRQFFCDHFDHLRLERLAGCTLPELRALAGQMLAEERLAIGHADQWIERLGRAADEAHRRIQAALEQLAPLACELFEPTAGDATLVAAGILPSPAGIFERWATTVTSVTDAGRLRVQLAAPPADLAAGRQGRHSPAFAELLDELSEVFRLEPEAAW
jgi:ring-1,2-phenylacetyl-CoA epoxidase subunit PaaC